MRLMLALGVVTMAACSSTSEPPKPALTYPATTMGSVVDDFGGTKVADPYRWMESLDSAGSEGVDHRAERGDRSVSGRASASQGAERAADRVVELPSRRAAVARRRPDVLCEELRPSATGADLQARRHRQAPNARDRSERDLGRRDGLARASTKCRPTRSSWPTACLKAAPTGRRFTSATSAPARIWPTRFAGCASPESRGRKDAKGFYYSRYPEPPKGKVLEAALSGHTLYYHRVGTPQSQDLLVYERKDLPGGSSTAA